MTRSFPDSFPRLLADIGGTNARFAWQATAGDRPAKATSLPCADYPGPAEAIRAYLAQHHLPAPRWLAMGVATALRGDRVTMTNNHWDFSVADLQKALGLTHVRLLNDFTALALALPDLDATECLQVGGGTGLAGAPLALLGAGTGLGVSGLFTAPDGSLVAIEGEGGHATLAARTPREAQVIERVAPQFADESLHHVSAERVLSGPGLEAVYRAVVAEHAGVPADRPAADITARSVDGDCPACVESLALFCAFVGTVAGDLALTLGARGGVYIGGGIVPRLGQAFGDSGFRARFEDRGRFSSYLRDIPVWVIHTPYPAILGAARALQQDAARRSGS